MSQFCNFPIFIIKIWNYLNFIHVYYLSPFGKAYTYAAVPLLRHQTPAASRSVPPCPLHLPTNRSNTPPQFRPPSPFKHTTNLSQHRTSFHLLHMACLYIVATLFFNYCNWIRLISLAILLLAQVYCTSSHNLKVKSSILNLNCTFYCCFSTFYRLHSLKIRIILEGVFLHNVLRRRFNLRI